MCTSRRQHDLTLIELIMFIVIVSVALAGVLTVLNHTVRHSADPMIRKQALAIAEAVLEEVMLQPFTWCDPDHSQAATAEDATSCTAELIGKEGGETRGHATLPLDNVSDYHNESINTKITGTGDTALYPASVKVEESALNSIGSGAALLITVSVTAGEEIVELQGYRTRHSPNLLP